jgi:methyl-accepting chemotaxis protein
VGQGTSAAQKAERSLTRIAGQVQEIADHLKGITAAMGEQGRASEEVVAAIGSAARRAERNASAVTQLSATVQQTAQTTEELAELAQRLQILTGRFRLA